MARLIDADKLLEKVQFRLPIDNQNAEVIAGCVDITRRLIENAPTVDAVEVVHGRWLYYSATMQECSICQRHTARHKFKYCPHCGAVMEDKYNDGL